MEQLNLKKELKHLYQPSAKAPVQVDVPRMNFLMLDGAGDPNGSQAYADGVEALFALSYTIKFMVKRGPLAIDYGVMPLEGLWWVDDMSRFSVDDRNDWQWTMLMMQPDVVTLELVEEAVTEVRRKKDPAALGEVRFEALAEGTCVQILHVGPFSTEGPTIARLHGLIAAGGHEPAGKHHEIYLSDIRKAAPEKWKTVIRQPLR